MAAAFVVIATTSVGSGLLNFKYDTIPGAAAVLNGVYFLAGELLWRTKEARETFMGSSETAAPAAAAEDKAKKRSAIYDRLTTVFCGLSISGMAVSSNVILLKRGFREQTSPLVTGAAFVALAGAILLRRSAMLTLGSRFTMALAKVKDHKVCREGIYAWIRHPGYAANALLFSSLPILTTGNPKFAAACVAWFFVVWGTRIAAEEKMLKSDAEIGADYQAYCKEVRARLIPFVF